MSSCHPLSRTASATALAKSVPPCQRSAVARRHQLHLLAAEHPEMFALGPVVMVDEPDRLPTLSCTSVWIFSPVSDAAA